MELLGQQNLPLERWVLRGCWVSLERDIVLHFLVVMLKSDFPCFRRHLFWIVRMLRAPWWLGGRTEQAAQGGQNSERLRLHTEGVALV